MWLRLLADCNTTNQPGSSNTTHLPNPFLKPVAAAYCLNMLQYCFTSQLNWLSNLLSHLSVPVLFFLLSRVTGFSFPRHTSSSNTPDNRTFLLTRANWFCPFKQFFLFSWLPYLIVVTCTRYVYFYISSSKTVCVMYWIDALSAPNTVIICYTWYCLSGIQHITPSKGPTCLNWLTCTRCWTVCCRGFVTCLITSLLKNFSAYACDFKEYWTGK